MITITLDERKYSVKYVSGRALRGVKAIEDLMEQAKGRQELDAQLVYAAGWWFCSLFDNQFSVEEMLNACPQDALLRDMARAYQTIGFCLSKAFSGFVKKPPTEEVGHSKTATLWESIMRLYSQLLKQGWRMTDIDDCDLLGYIQVLAFESGEEAQPEGTIDQLPFFCCSE